MSKNAFFHKAAIHHADRRKILTKMAKMSQ